MIRSLAILVLLVTSSCTDSGGLEAEVCPESSTLGYDNFGGAFVGRYCQSCHASDSGQREGAPSEVTFDSAKEIRDQASRVFERSALDNTSMPPGPDGPSEKERSDLAEWLACGAL